MHRLLSHSSTIGLKKRIMLNLVYNSSSASYAGKKAKDSKSSSSSPELSLLLLIPMSYFLHGFKAVKVQSKKQARLKRYKSNLKKLHPQKITSKCSSAKILLEITRKPSANFVS
jgi:hypothetical protein